MKNYNVLYIHTHDSGQIFSPYGYDVPTDALEEFARDAVVFDNAFCTSPTCSPSRSALVTGLYPHHNGMLGLANRGFCLEDYHSHMARLFGESGYNTVLCGIQHEYGRYTEHQKGAEMIGYQQDISSDCSSFSEKEMVQWDRDNVDCFRQWLGAYEDDKPFFLSFGFFSTHREYPVLSEGSAAWDGALPRFLQDCPEIREDYKGHLESLKLFDRNFGLLIQALKEKGCYNNTIILFTTDHGIAFPGAKCTLYDAGIRVALMMRVPGKEQGRRVKSLVSHVDILPTLCGLLQLDPGRSFDGVDFGNVFDDPESVVRNEIFAEVNFHTSYEPMRCIRTERFKYIRYYDTEYLKPKLSNIDNSISKTLYIECGLLDSEKDEEQFYDLLMDPLERDNQIGNPEFRNEIILLKDEMYKIQENTGDIILQGRIPVRSQWIVNINECVDPKSKASTDFIAT